jgi:type IV pilus assembly protein PilA
MLARIRKAQEEEGFTLIELLVVIIIIGILAAIAIPVFLNQRKKGYDASAKSDLRNAATAEETVLTSGAAYSAALTAQGFKPTTNVTTKAGLNGSTGYCLVANNSGSDKWFLYDSQNGGLKATAYADEATAEGACSDAAITSFAAVT